MNVHSRSCSFRFPPWSVALLLGLLAMLPRCLKLDDFFTVDEGYHWVWRVNHFARALEQGHWAATNLTGHPGITTLWLGWVGRKIALMVGLSGPEWGQGSVDYLALLRLPLAITNSLVIVLGYLVLRQLLDAPTALLACLFWAWSPFIIAHSRLLHVDGLLTSFMTLSILLLLLSVRVMWHRSPSSRASWMFLVSSGAAAGFALLTKSPALIVCPLVGLLLSVLLFPSVPTTYHAHPALLMFVRIRYIAVRYALWCVCALMVFAIGWPAMWVEPRAALSRVLQEVLNNGAQTHESGNFFLGKPVADPGPLFYPVVVLWRSTPIGFIGLLMLPFAMHHYRRTQPRTFPILLSLIGFALVFGLAMTMMRKKFDRYLLPIWPTLEILAAVGLTTFPHLQAPKRFWSPIAEGFTRLRQRFPLPPNPSLAFTVISMALLLIDLWYHPYYLAYFTPLLGGGKVAQRILLVGWGEGMEQVGAWLRQRPDVGKSPILSWDPPTLAPFLPVRVEYFNEVTLKSPASYVVLYTRGWQREPSTTAIDQVRRSPPLYTLRMHGIEYAQVYQPALPFSEPVGAIFGDEERDPQHEQGRTNQLYLRGYSSVHTPELLTLSLSWEVRRPMAGGWYCFVHVLDEGGKRVAQVDVPLDEGRFPHWQVGQQFGGPLPIQLPRDIPSGTYRVVVGVYRPPDGPRLPLLGCDRPCRRSEDSPHALMLMQWVVPRQ